MQPHVLQAQEPPQRTHAHTHTHPHYCSSMAMACTSSQESWTCRHWSIGVHSHGEQNKGKRSSSHLSCSGASTHPKLKGPLKGTHKHKKRFQTHTHTHN